MKVLFLSALSFASATGQGSTTSGYDFQCCPMKFISGQSSILDGWYHFAGLADRALPRECGTDNPCLYARTNNSSQKYCMAPSHEGDSTCYLDESGSEESGSGIEGDLVNSNLTITCDNYLAVWIDGVFQRDDGNFNDWTKTSTIQLYAASSVVAVSCADKSLPPSEVNVRGILGSTSLGGVTDTAHWKCSQQPQSGWQETNFAEDSTWVAPSSYRNDVSPLLNSLAVSPWHYLSSIAASAEWIWIESSDSTKPGPSRIFCRYHIY